MDSRAATERESFLADRAAPDAAGMEAALLVLGLAYPIAIRLYLLVSTDFPINDGGLFLAFINALAQSFPRLPEFVSYNGLNLPFAYPPLAFWASAGLVHVGVDPLWILHRLPVLMNIAYVLLFALLLRRAGYSRLFTAFALLAFGTSLRSFEWLVMGGGLSRGLGSLFMMATLLLLYRPASEPSLPAPAWRLALAGACVAGAVLSHLEWGILTAALSLLCLALRTRDIRRFAGTALAVGLTAIVLVAPWFITVVARHGLSPFIAAAASGGHFSYAIVNIARSMLGQSSFLLPFVALGVRSLFRREERFWLWFAACVVLFTPRHGPTPLMLPLAIVTAHGILDAIRMLERRGATRTSATAQVAAITFALVLCRTGYDFWRAEYFRPLPSDVRSAMAWVRQAHPGTTFAVINEAPWESDASAEWFPVLAGAVNTTTVQGREWLPNASFTKSRRAVESLKASRSCTTLFRRMRRLPMPDFIWAETNRSCFATPAFEQLYANPGVGIWRVRR